MKTIIAAITGLFLLTAVSTEALSQVLGPSRAADQYRTRPRNPDIAIPETQTKNYNNFRSSSDESEISIFDKNGNPKAYIAEDLTIYLWSGEPVAMLYQSNSIWHVYGYNGAHLGWYEDGIIYDNNGYPIGAQKGAVNMITNIEPIKDVKNIKPIKGIKEISPIKPIFSNSWGQTPLIIFLRAGEN